jgi:tetratricopeptide (TPR) repeat protein
MLPWLGQTFRFLRRRWLTTLVLVVVLLSGVAIGLHFWAWRCYAAAERAVEDDRLADARDQIQACLRLWRWSIPAHLLAAKIERFDQHYVTANHYLDLCGRLMSKPNERVQLERIFVRAETGELAEVEDGLREAMKRESPYRVEILETLARVYAQNAQLTRAKNALDRWLELDPNSSRAWFWTGWVEEHSKRRVEAISAYQRCLELNPNRAKAAEYIAEGLLTEHRSSEALPYITLLVEKHPESVAGRLLLAEYHTAQGEAPQARKVLDDLLREQPDLFAALVQRGKLACEEGKPKAGEVWLRKALDQRPHEPLLLNTYQRCLGQLGRTADAARVREQYEAAARDFTRLDDLFTFGVERAKGDPAVCCEVARLLTKLDLPDEAVEWYYRAISRDHNCVEAHKGLEKFYREHNEPERAQLHAEKLRQLQQQGALPLPPSTQR